MASFWGHVILKFLKIGPQVPSSLFMTAKHRALIKFAFAIRDSEKSDTVCRFGDDSLKILETVDRPRWDLE